MLAGLALAARGGRGARGGRLPEGLVRPAAAARSRRARRGVGLDGLSVRVRRGDDGYVAGEETALLEALEGRRPWPRPKPPLPGGGRLPRPADPRPERGDAGAGAGGDRRSGGLPAGRDDARLALGRRAAARRLRGARCGTPLRRVIDEHGGGAPEEIGLVFPAGPSAAPLSAGRARRAARSRRAARARARRSAPPPCSWSARSACPLAVAASLAAFFERESCGQCPPCARGTASLARILRAVEAGGSRPRDLRDLAEVAGFMAVHGYCAHCRTAAGVATAMARGFAEAVDRAREGGLLPVAGATAPRPLPPHSPERAAVEAAVQEQLR